MSRLSSSGTMHLCLVFLQTWLLTLFYTGRIVSPQLGAEQMTILTEYSLAEQVFIEKKNMLAAEMFHASRRGAWEHTICSELSVSPGVSSAPG